MGKTIVLGIGNRLMMDDGIGIYLAEKLGKERTQTQVAYIAGESDIDYCLAVIEKAELTIILDAVCTGRKPGELSVYSLSELESYQSLDLSVHNAHLFGVLFEQKKLSPGFLIGIEPYKIDFHIGLSICLQEQWDRILEQTERLIDGILAEYG